MQFARKSLLHYLHCPQCKNKASTFRYQQICAVQRHAGEKLRCQWNSWNVILLWQRHSFTTDVIKLTGNSSKAVTSKYCKHLLWGMRILFGFVRKKALEKSGTLSMIWRMLNPQTCYFRDISNPSKSAGQVNYIIFIIFLTL